VDRQLRLFAVSFVGRGGFGTTSAIYTGVFGNDQGQELLFDSLNRPLQFYHLITARSFPLNYTASSLSKNAAMLPFTLRGAVHPRQTAKPGPEQVTISSEHLSLLLRSRTGQSAPAPISLGSFYPPCITATGPSPLVKPTLLYMFPFVKGSLLLAILRHIFTPNVLYKLDLNRTLNSVPGSISASRRAQGQDLSKDYPSLSSLLSPLTVYFRIVATALVSNRDTLKLFAFADGSTKYLSQLVAFSEKYAWSAVIQYHIEVHERRLDEMREGDYTGWGKLDVELQLRHLYHNELGAGGDDAGKCGCSHMDSATWLAAMAMLMMIQIPS